jgi:hypothetical protein
MLERLEEVPWGELNAAYGPTEWVPEAIQELLDPDPEARESAPDRIEGGTFHQETADEATLHVVPFLIELAGDPATPDRTRLVTVQCLESDLFPASLAWEDYSTYPSGL